MTLCKWRRDSVKHSRAFRSRASCERGLKIRKTKILLHSRCDRCIRYRLILFEKCVTELRLKPLIQHVMFMNSENNTRTREEDVTEGCIVQTEGIGGSLESSTVQI